MSKIFAYKPSAYKEGKAYLVIPSGADKFYSFSRPAAADRIDPDGDIATMAINVPRIDYTDGGCPVLLLEGEDTNYIKYSERFESAPGTQWNRQSVVVVEDAIDSVVSNKKAQLVYPSSSGNYRGIKANVGLSTVAVKKVIVKYAGIPAINILRNSGIVIGGYNFLTKDTYGDAVVTELNNGWVELDVDDGNVGEGDLYVILSDSLNSQSVTSNGTDGVYIAGTQLSNNKGSYIPTNGSTVTREAEICGNYTQTYDPNSLVWKLNTKAISNDGTIRNCSISDASGNSYQVRYTTTDDVVSVLVESSSSVQETINIPLDVIGYYSDIWVVADNGTLKVKTNGILRSVNTNITAPLSLTRKDYHDGLGGNSFSGRIKGDIVDDDVTSFNSTATSINEILNNSKLTIR